MVTLGEGKLSIVWMFVMVTIGSAVATASDSEANGPALEGDEKDLGLMSLESLVGSMSMIVMSELGDKTFFIAAVMAMRHTRGEVFSGAMAAVALMTVLSAVLGIALPALLPRPYTHYAAVALFFFFGFRLLNDAYNMDAGVNNDELAEVENEIQELEEKEKLTGAPDIENGGTGPIAQSRKKNTVFGLSPVISEAFVLTFVAEWGDRSQIATIAMAAAGDPIGVIVGACIGHAICTALAVVGGKALASKISERHVTFGGGILFLVFGVHALIIGPLA